MSFVSEVRIKQSRFSRFDELITGNRTSSFNLKPTWGVSDLRESTDVTGTGAAIIETGGEYKLSTGTDAAGYAELTTRQRGQYQAGTEGEIGIGVRIPTLPTGDQFAEWGYFDDNNGFGFGVDATSPYVFYISGGSKTIIHQADWNIDPINGSGPSGLTLDLAVGDIYEMEFTWYGYGDVQFRVNMDDPTKKEPRRVNAHWLDVENQVTIVDPNQPIRIRASNGGVTTSNFDVYIGGRQFSVVDGNSKPQRRETSVIRKGVSVTNLSYVPVLGVRSKATFNGRTNSVNSRLTSIEVASTQKVYWYISVGDTLDGSWTAIPRKQPTETSLEHNVSATLGGSTQLHSLEEGVVLSNNVNRNQVKSIAEIALGLNYPVTIWVAKDSMDAVVDVVLGFEEEW